MKNYNYKISNQTSEQMNESTKILKKKNERTYERSSSFLILKK